MSDALGWVNIPFVPTFAGIAKRLSDNFEKPATAAGRRAAKAVEKSAADMAKSLENQVSASSRKVEELGKAHKESIDKREIQQGKLNAAIAKQTAAEEEYQKALKRGESGSKQFAALELAKSKVTEENIKLTRSEDAITKALKDQEAQQKDLTDTTERFKKAQKDAADEAERSQGVFGNLRGGLDDVMGKASEMGGPVGGVADMLSEFKLGPAAGVAAVGGAFVVAATELGKFSSELEDSRVTMQNQFGLSADAARDMQAEVADALGSGLGDYETTAAAVTSISQVWGDEIAHMGGQTAAQLADDFMAFNQTFERSAEETASTVGVMLNSGMVSTAQEGLDLLTAGMQSVPAAMRDEVFDATNEYSKFFSQMGMDGEQAMAMLADAAENGQYAIDKTGDAVKEFSVRAIDPAVVERLSEYGIEVEDLAGRVARGGPEAASAMTEMAEQLKAIPDEGERAAAAVEAFGAPLEDLGDKMPDFLDTLSSGSDGMGDFEGAAQTMADNTTGTFSGMVASWKGQIHGWAIDGMLALNEWGGQAADAIINSPIAGAIGETLGDAKDLASGIGDILFRGDYTGLPFGLEEDSGFVDFLFQSRDSVIQFKDDSVAAWDEIKSAFTGGDWGYGALASLIGEDRAEDLINFIADIGDRFFEFKDNLLDGFEQAKEFVAPILEALREFFTEHMGKVFESIGDALGAMARAWESIGESVGGALWDALQGVFDILTSLWDLLSPLLLPVLKIIGGIVGGVLVGAFLGLVGAIRAVAEVIEVAAKIFEWLADNVITPIISVVGDLARAFGETLADEFDQAKQDFQAFGDLLGRVWGWIEDNVFEPMNLGIQRVAFWFQEQLYKIQMYWDGFQYLLKAGWDWVDENVFGAFGRGLDTLKGWFQSAVDGMVAIWETLKSSLAKPINWVIDFVYNDGIRNVWEQVASLLGMEDRTLPEIPAIAFNTGGIMPGPATPGKDVHHFFSPTAGMLSLSGAESVMRPEWTQAMGADYVNTMNAAARTGGVAGVRRKMAEAASHFADGGVIPHMKFSEGGIVDSIVGLIGRFFPGMTITDTWRNANDLHGQGKAVDASDGTDTTPGMQAMARFFHENYGPGLAELIHWPLNGWQNIDEGQPYNFGEPTNSQHRNHVHIASHAALPAPDNAEGWLARIGETLKNAGGAAINWARQRVADLVSSILEPIGKAIPDFGGGWIGDLPGEAYDFIAGNFISFIEGEANKQGGAGSYDGAAGTSGSVESWRTMAMEAMRRNGFNADDPAQVAAMLAQIGSESGGNPGIAQQIVDVNGTGESAGVGLLQIIPGTFAAHRDPSLPDDRRDPWANMNAALRYYRSRYGDDLTTMWGHGHGYKDGGIIDLASMLGATKFDVGGVWSPGTIGVNLSGEDEFVLKNSGMRSLGDILRTLGELVPMWKEQTESVARLADSAEEFAAAAAHYDSEEGVTARNSLRNVLGFGLDLPGSELILTILDGESAIWDARSRHIGHLETLAEKEEELEEARRALIELESAESELSREDQRKLDDAKKAVEEARADVAKAESDEKRASATEKVADAEEKLKRVREDLDAKSEESAKKRVEEIEKANEDVLSAEKALGEARAKQVADLDHITLISQGSIESMIPMAEGFASQLISMGAASGAVNAGLGQVVGALGSAASMAGPAGVTLGMAFAAVQVGIEIAQQVVAIVEEVIEKLHAVRMAALQSMADAWGVITEYVSLNIEMSQSVSSLQQELVRGLNEQRSAAFALQVATNDRHIAEVEGALAVAEARQALDREIELGALAAQIRLMGLHEDWDSYLAFQALVGQGVLEQWSDSAISALFTYEAARAQALQGELSARVEQIQAEAALADATRANLRNQEDLLTAQERLIRMAGEVAGIDLVEATATSQVANLVVEMAELQKKMDSNLIGKAGAFFGTSGPWSNEYRGQQAQMASMRAALDAVLEETGVSLANSQINRAIEQMKWVAATEGDTMAVLRQFMPELVAAETALKVQETLKPIDDARDAARDAEREVEDYRSEIDLYDKVTPLEETIKGLDYTIQSLQSAAEAWADGNESLRGEHLSLAEANQAAAEQLGIRWKFDEEFMTANLRAQLQQEVKRVTVNLDGSKMYTADEIDELLAEVTEGTNVAVETKKTASKVADARRKEKV